MGVSHGDTLEAECGTMTLQNLCSPHCKRLSCCGEVSVLYRGITFKEALVYLGGVNHARHPLPREKPGRARFLISCNAPGETVPRLFRILLLANIRPDSARSIRVNSRFFSHLVERDNACGGIE